MTNGQFLEMNSRSIDFYDWLLFIMGLSRFIFTELYYPIVQTHTFYLFTRQQVDIRVVSFANNAVTLFCISVCGYMF